MPMSNNGDLRPQSAADILDDATPLRELIELAGKDSVGKTSFIVSMARFVELTNPAAKFYVIDSEKKFKSILKGFGAEAPRNIIYYPVDDMAQAVEAWEQVAASYNPLDWIAVESMSRIWEHAQNYGYNVIAGVSKAEFLKAKVGQQMPTGISKKNSPIPFATSDDPDRKLWPIVKDMHDAQFLHQLINHTDLNVILTTTVSRPRGGDPNSKVKESADRKAVRIELGIDASLDGAPRLPYQPETLCMLDLAQGQFSCQVLRDNLSLADNSRDTFPITDKRSGGTWFMYKCRGNEMARALLLSTGALIEETT